MMKEKKVKIWVKKGYGSKKIWLKIAEKLFKYVQKLKVAKKPTK